MKAKDKIIISKNDLKPANTISREQWDKHFKLAIKAGQPDKTKNKNILNLFDKSGWAWS